MKLYVGNLPWDINSEKLTELVLPFGEPESVNVITDRETGQSRGFAFVELRSADEGRAAMNGLNGKEVNGRPIVVNEARPDKGGSRGGYGGRNSRGGGRGGRRW